ncbi:TPA: carboxymuconolactone decarboxylase family protein [Enterobacter soli]|nr:carboxymuconolactone decarboxylase family protein [Enterobacter soli]
MKVNASVLSDADIQSVSPALVRFGNEVISGELWQRNELSARDRSIVTLAILIARNQPAELKHYVEVALECGVTPAEISEVITHLAFYSGWPNAMAAIAVTKDIFRTRGVSPDELPQATPQLLPLNEEAERLRAETVKKNVEPVSPGLVKFTADPLFLELWQRPALAPRDRSLVTVSALIAAGQSAQIGYHLNRAMDNGLTAQEAGEIVAHAAFYAGWPNAFSAVGVVGGSIAGKESLVRPC